MNKLLTATTISHHYDSDQGAVHALDDITLSLKRGEFVCLVGSSGCGKSTLLRLLAGLLQPTEGSVSIDGDPLIKPDPRLGYLFQQSNLMPWRSVIENITLPLELAGIGRGNRETAALNLIERVGLSGFEQAYPAELSGGMAGRVAIARALINQPEILLLDEPFGALDAMTRERLGEELLGIWQGDNSNLSAVLMVTHDINESIYLADRILVMGPRPGSIVGEFTVGLPRPRRLDMLHSPEAGRLSMAIRSALAGR